MAGVVAGLVLLWMAVANTGYRRPQRPLVRGVDPAKTFYIAAATQTVDCA